MPNRILIQNLLNVADLVIKSRVPYRYHNRRQGQIGLW